MLTGGVLGSVSPYGFEGAMTGRYAYLNDSVRGCAAGLRRLRVILDAAGAAVESVGLLPDRSSRILGLAAADVLGLSAVEFDPDRPAEGALVVAYDLALCDSGVVAALRGRVPGQVLFERATCWTDPPRVSADVCGLLAQMAVAPWEGQLGRLEDGTAGLLPGDDRPVEEIAAEVACAEPEDDFGDGSAPPDTDEGLRRFAEAVTGVEAREVGGGGSRATVITCLTAVQCQVAASPDAGRRTDAHRGAECGPSGDAGVGLGSLAMTQQGKFSGGSRNGQSG